MSGPECLSQYHPRAKTFLLSLREESLYSLQQRKSVDFRLAIRAKYTQQTKRIYTLKFINYKYEVYKYIYIFFFASGTYTKNKHGLHKGVYIGSNFLFAFQELSNGENDLIFNAAPSCDDVIQVIRLCSDQALLGNRLLETAASVAHDRVSGTGSNKGESNLFLRSFRSFSNCNCTSVGEKAFCIGWVACVLLQVIGFVSATRHNLVFLTTALTTWYANDMDFLV